ncbi:hypothetical protein NL676_035055 [Syzygium grande]|nr:hypothetical protein NL676_035055 [Syzygium grande]
MDLAEDRIVATTLEKRKRELYPEKSPDWQLIRTHDRVKNKERSSLRRLMREEIAPPPRTQGLLDEPGWPDGSNSLANSAAAEEKAEDEDEEEVEDEDEGRRPRPRRRTRTRPRAWPRVASPLPPQVEMIAMDGELRRNRIEIALLLPRFF